MSGWTGPPVRKRWLQKRCRHIELRIIGLAYTFGHSLLSGSVLRFTTLLLLISTLSLRAQAQALLTPASELASYVRLLELQGKAQETPMVYWSSSTAPRRNGFAVDSGHVWSRRFSLAAPGEQPQRPTFRVLDAQADLFFNSDFPRNTNDGAVWAGRGLSGTLRGAVEARWRGFTARVAPTFGYSQNRDFTLGTGPGTSATPFAYPWQQNIDFPQRFGTASLTFADWGQSSLRFDAGAFTAGFSTENLWWGPGYRNAIVLGSSAPGFPHLDIGLGRPAHTPVGDVELRAIWGQLSRSSFFVSGSTNGKRLFSGLTLGYRPKLLSGLTLGLTRVLYKEWPEDGFAARDLLDAFSGVFNQGTQTDPNGPRVNNQSDQLASLTGRWTLPEAGAEFYLEFARNDFAGGITDLILEPEHSRAFTVGFQKTLPVSTGALVLRGEHTTLGQSATKDLRDGAPFYVHGIVTEGYTHRGQLLGAAIGPGSNSQYVGVDRYSTAGRYGFFVERIRYDDDFAFTALKERSNGYLMHQTDLTAGFSTIRFSGPVDLGTTLVMTRQLNRYFDRYNNITNWALTFTLGWHQDPRSTSQR